MSVFMDLNICYTPDRNRLKGLVETAANRECLQPRKSASNRKSLLCDDANSASKLLRFFGGSSSCVAATLMPHLQKTVTFTFSLLPVVQITWFINSYCFLDEKRKDVFLSVGFSTVAINYTFEPAAKAKQVTLNRQVRSREQ